MEELGYRAALGYPPFGRGTQGIGSSEDPESAGKAAEALATTVRGDAIEVRPEEAAAFEVLGPVPAPLARLRGKHRMQIVIRGTDAEAVQRASSQLARAGRRLGRDVQLTVDTDPVDML